MLPVERVIGESGLAAGPDGARLDIRLPWYRSLPLSTVEIESLTIDGQPVALESLEFELDGERWPLPKLADLTDEVWFVLDSAYLVLPGERLEPGSTHQVALTTSVYP